MSGDIQPFRIAASDSQLNDLKRRLRETRWPERECVDDWSQGVAARLPQEVATYWLEKYDWRAREARLNRFPQFKTTSTGLRYTSCTFAPLTPTHDRS
jgi:epoxide hydrolase